MEQKRELTEQEAAEIKAHAADFLTQIPRPWMLTEGDKDSIQSNFSDGYTACAERSVPLSAFLELREALMEARRYVPFEFITMRMQIDDALSSTEKYKPLS